MSLRNINHQAAIELGECDTEYVAGLKQERERLLQERQSLHPRRYSSIGAHKRRCAIRERLSRIEELLAK